MGCCTGLHKQHFCASPIEDPSKEKSSVNMKIFISLKYLQVKLQLPQWHSLEHTNKSHAVSWFGWG